MNLKSYILNQIIVTEGGYVDDPFDSGGETNYGITKATAYAYGYRGEMRLLTRTQAYEIYEKKYWNNYRMDEIVAISPLIAEEVADTGVNIGMGTAVKFLQRSLNILNNRGQYFDDLRVDGINGAKTLFALESYLIKRKREGEAILVEMLNTFQSARYIRLAERNEKNETFIYGWFRTRVTRRK